MDQLYMGLKILIEMDEKATPFLSNDALIVHITADLELLQDDIDDLIDLGWKRGSHLHKNQWIYNVPHKKSAAVWS